MSVENPVPAKRPRRTRRQSLPALAAKIGFVPTAIEQSPDGTIRLLADGATLDPSTANLDRELAEWKARRGQAQP